VTDLDVGQIKIVKYSPRVFGLATRICMPSEALGPMGADRIVGVMFRLQRGAAFPQSWLLEYRRETASNDIKGLV
jgi:hypothetical protein